MSRYLSRGFVVIVGSILMSSGASAQTRSTAISIEGENCPPGMTYVAQDEAQNKLHLICGAVDDFEISRIGRGGSISGRGHQPGGNRLCTFKREDPRKLTTSLCVPTADPPLPMPEVMVPLPAPTPANLRRGGRHCGANETPLSVQEAVNQRASLCASLKRQGQPGDTARLAEGAALTLLINGDCQIIRRDDRARFQAFCKALPPPPQDPLPLLPGDTLPSGLETPDVIIARGSVCPPETLLITVEDLSARSIDVCNRLRNSDVAKIADGGVMLRTSGNCIIYRRSALPPTAAICRSNVITDGDSQVPDAVARFAPVLIFDKNATTFPMSPQPFFDKLPKDAAGKPTPMPGKAPLGVENTDPGTVANGTAPTYFQFRQFGKQMRIKYWWFYGYQHSCGWGQGTHNGDWESITVIVSEDRDSVVAVQYELHGVSYTRIAGLRNAPCTPGGTLRCEREGIPMSGERPMVYVGRDTHASYDHPTLGSNPGVSCAIWSDGREPGGPGYVTARKLINLDRATESWIAADRLGGWDWGPDGIGRHPTQDPPTADMLACKGSPTSNVWDSGCYNSECLAGDDEASENCIKECKRGYTNIGAFCSNTVTDFYGRLQGDRWYRYDYRIPLSDIGLKRRRNSEDAREWDLP